MTKTPASKPGFSFKAVCQAAARSSLSAPRMMILSASLGNGRCSVFASSHGARIQTSRSSSVVRITGIAFRRRCDVVKNSVIEQITILPLRESYLSIEPSYEKLPS